MPRISLDPPRSLAYRVGTWYTTRMAGRAFDSLKAVAHNRRVLSTLLITEQRVTKWRALDPKLKHMALMVSAARIGCAWCIDFGYWEAAELGIANEKLRKIADWRSNRDAFAELELLVLEYAEAMTATPPQVGDGLSARLKDLLGEAGLVELTAIVALENFRSRVNSALGLTGQGFSDNCAVRPAYDEARG
ncbi:carboxymuconolactone decarboxylase family protein [Sciscionella marina]|uniref:carboxymuconolactone decarboxylase family protein n=1 Tax=Sciscionella marina TaxID=508770 RepID=UPI00037C5FEE|nr:carboxymuconolactone decarboxylase family protein [Sciscionella marina]